MSVRVSPHRTLATLTSIFAKVNAEFRDTGENDDEQELDFDEFKDVLVRVCHAKLAESQRDNGTPFEHSLHSWLQLIFVPKYRAILKLKKFNIGQRTL